MVTCPKCKEIYHENATHCPACGTEAPKGTSAGITSLTSYTTVSMTPGFTYAPFGERVLACFIDSVIVIVFTGILGGILGGIFGDFGTFLSFVTTACYYGYFESSNYMGTPGKIIMKLKVIKETGKPISFLNGVGRYAAKFLSSIILGIGYLFPLFTPKKQTLHDIVASCIVVKAK